MGTPILSVGRLSALLFTLRVNQLFATMTKQSDSATFYLTIGKIIQDLKAGTITYDSVQIDGEKDVKAFAALQKEQAQPQTVQARTASQAKQREHSRGLARKFR